MAGRRFAYGEHDCGLFLGEWIFRLTGRNPVAHFRGCYHDETSLRDLARPFGWPRLLDQHLASAGMVRTREPQLGDVALILLHDRKPRAVVRTALGFVTVAERRGLWGIRDEVRLFRAWTFP